MSQWCHSTTSSSVVPFSSHLQSFPASGSFQMSQFFASGGQSIAVSASASVLPMNFTYLKFEFYIVLKLISNHNNLEHISTKYFSEGFPDGPIVQNRPCNAGDISSILGQEDASGATKPVHHNYWALALEPESCYWSPLEPVLWQQEKAPHWEAWATHLDKAPVLQWRPSTAKK